MENDTTDKGNSSVDEQIAGLKNGFSRGLSCVEITGDRNDNHQASTCGETFGPYQRIRKPN